MLPVSPPWRRRRVSHQPLRRHRPHRACDGSHTAAARPDTACPGAAHPAKLPAPLRSPIVAVSYSCHFLATYSRLQAGTECLPSSCPSAAECFTKSDQGLQSRELVLTELIARRVQRALRVQHRQVIAGPFLVAKLGACKGSL